MTEKTALNEIISARIAEQGRITFAEFMGACLYQPGLGYYTSPGRKVGAEGDFYTSITVHAAFGRVIAREIPLNRRQATIALIDEHVYRNPLMAFGVVTANREEMVRVQQDLDLLAQGFKQCDAWVHASKEGDIKPAACNT